MIREARRAKIVNLPLAPRPIESAFRSDMVLRVRTSLSLLQGYADIMEGLSPELKAQVMGVMAEKSKDLVEALRPFVESDPELRPALADYRKLRERTRRLLNDYRVALDRLHATVVASPVAGGKP